MRVIICAALAVLAGAAPTPASEVARPEHAVSAGPKWLSTRLTIGARFTYFWLEDARRSGENGPDNGNTDINFLGSLWGLDADQHYFPNPYIEYRIAGGVGIGVNYDQVRAKTLDWADNESQDVTAGDGDLEIRGVGVYVLWQHRSSGKFGPYATAGYAWYQSHFDVSPGWSAPGRRFEVDDTDGWFVSGGCQMRLTRHVAVDLTYRHSHIGDVVARAYFRPNRYRAGAFPMQNDSLAIGLRYAF